MCAVVEALVQAALEAEMTEAIGAAKDIAMLCPPANLAIAVCVRGKILLDVVT